MLRLPVHFFMETLVFPNDDCTASIGEAVLLIANLNMSFK